MSIGPTNPLLLKGKPPSSTASPSAPPKTINAYSGRFFHAFNYLDKPYIMEWKEGIV